MNPTTLLCQEILALDSKATPNPWKADHGNWNVEGPEREDIADLSSHHREHNGEGFISKADPHDDMDLIAHYRTSAPLLAKKLLIAIEALEKIANNIYTSDDYGYCILATDALKELETDE